MLAALWYSPESRGRPRHLRQEASYVRRQRVLQARRVFDEPRDVGDLAWKQVIEEFVLNQENGILSPDQLSRERGLSGRHLATQEDQLGRRVHASQVLLRIGAGGSSAATGPNPNGPTASCFTMCHILREDFRLGRGPTIAWRARSSNGRASVLISIRRWRHTDRDGTTTAPLTGAS